MSTAISIVRGESWLDLPLNVDAISDIAVDDEGYIFTGFLGLVAAKAKAAGIKHRLSVLAAEDAMRGMVYSARLVAGYGAQQFVSRMAITPETFFVIAACAAENTPELLPAEFDKIFIVDTGRRTFIPSFLKGVTV